MLSINLSPAPALLSILAGLPPNALSQDRQSKGEQGRADMIVW